MLFKWSRFIIIIGIFAGLTQAQDITPTALPVFPITPGSVEGNINDQFPSLRYSFDVVAGDQVTIDMQTTSGDLDPFLFLFDPAERLLDSNDDAESGTRDAQITFTAELDGAFIIEATRFEQEAGLTSGTFRLNLRVAGVVDEDSVVDPLSLSPPFGVNYDFIEYDQFGAGSINDETPTRYYALGGQQGDFVRITMTTTNGDLVPTVNLLNQEFAIISQTAAVSGGETVIYATLPETGWYLVEAGRAAGGGDFTLFPARLVEALLESGRTIEGEFTPDTPTILYVFNGTIEDRVFATLTGLNAGLQPEVTILDLNQRILAQRDSSGDQARVRAIIPRSGTYIVQVTNRAANTRGTFELTLRRIPIDISKLEVESATYNSSYKGSINNDNPVDYYRFAGKAGELVTVEMRLAEDNMIFDPFLILADSELNELAVTDTSGGTRSARITQFALEEDGEYFIIASRAGLASGTSYGSYDLEITAGQIALQPGILTATVNWEGSADLNLFLRDASGRIVSWANPAVETGARLQIDSNTNCDTPSAQPIEHIYWTIPELPAGDYTVWVWHQNTCGMPDAVPFSLSLTFNGEEKLLISPEDEQTLRPDERFETSLRVFETSSSLLNPGSISQPTAQQRASQGGDTPIRYGESLTANISNDVYARFFQFRGEAGDEIRILAEQLTGDLDPIVVLRDDRDNNLAINDDASGRNSRITFTLPENGRYVIGVTRYGVRDGRTVGDFRLTLERSP